jgi:hypothetical protein
MVRSFRTDQIGVVAIIRASSRRRRIDTNARAVGGVPRL